MTTKTGAETIAINPVDPWAGSTTVMSAARRALLEPAERPPAQWGTLEPIERELVGGLALHILARHGAAGPIGPQLHYLVARFGEALRACSAREERGGHGHALSGYFEPDESRRRRWARISAALQSPPFVGVFLVEELFAALGAAGDLRETLVARRAAIDRQLARLEKTLGAGR